MMSASSVVSAVLVYTVMMGALFLLKREERFLTTGGVSILLASFGLILARVSLPVEIPITYSLHLWNLLGAPHRIIRAHPGLSRFLIAGWIVGAAVVLARDAYILVRARKTCRDYDVIDSPQIQQIAKDMNIPCSVVVSPQVSSPYVTGPLKHTIYLPVLEFPEEEIRLILLHEREHIRLRDGVFKLAYGIISAIWWWNPVSLLFRKTLDNLLEMRCDRVVMSSISAEQREVYHNMILSLSELDVLDRAELAFSMDESGAMRRTNDTKRRLNVLKAWVDDPPQNQKRSNVVVGVCLALVLFFASYLVVLQPASAPTEDAFEQEIGVSYSGKCEGFELGQGPQDVFILKGLDGRYQLFVNYEFSGYLKYDEVISEKYSNFRIFEEE